MNNLFPSFSKAERLSNAGAPTAEGLELILSPLYKSDGALIHISLVIWFHISRETVYMVWKDFQQTKQMPISSSEAVSERSLHPGKK